MIKELKPSKKRTEEDRSRLMATVGDIIADVRMNGACHGMFPCDKRH